MYSTELNVSDRSQLPKPTGYRLLVAIPKVEAKTKGGIHLPDSLKKAEETASIFACVMEMGPDAYRDVDKFPTGPWCKLHDWVVIRSYSGTRFKIRSDNATTEFRIINDDAVEAVVDDPRGIERA